MSESIPVDKIPVNVNTVSLFDSVHDFDKIATDATMLIRELKDEWGIKDDDKYHNFLLKFMFAILGKFGFNQETDLIINNSGVRTFKGKMETRYSGHSIEDYFFYKYLKKHVSEEDQKELNKIFQGKKVGYKNNKLSKFTEEIETIEDILFDIKILVRTKKLDEKYNPDEGDITVGQHNYKELTDFFEEYHLETGLKNTINAGEMNKIIPIVVDVQNNLYKLIQYCKAGSVKDEHNKNTKLMYCLNQEVINDPGTKITLDSDALRYFEHVGIEKADQVREYKLEGENDANTVHGYYNITFNGLYLTSKAGTEQVDNAARTVKFGTKIMLTSKSEDGSEIKSRFRKISNSDINTIEFIDDKIKGLQREIREKLHEYCCKNQDAITSFNLDGDYTKLYEKIFEIYKNDNNEISEIEDFYKNIIMFFSRKRYGDQLQANSCGKLINYKLLDLSQEKPKDKLDNSVDEVSINKSVFVTFDRMAASYAMMKKIPIIYENNNKKIMILIKPKTVPRETELEPGTGTVTGTEPQSDPKTVPTPGTGMTLRNRKTLGKGTGTGMTLRDGKTLGNVTGKGIKGGSTKTLSKEEQDEENMTDVFNNELITKNITKYPDIFLHSTCYLLTINKSEQNLRHKQFKKARELDDSVVLDVSTFEKEGDTYYSESNVDYLLTRDNDDLKNTIYDNNKRENNMFIDLKDDEGKIIIQVKKENNKKFVIQFSDTSQYETILTSNLTWIKDKSEIDKIIDIIVSGKPIQDSVTEMFSELFEQIQRGGAKASAPNAFIQERLRINKEILGGYFNTPDDKEKSLIVKYALDLSRAELMILNIIFKLLKLHELYSITDHEQIKNYFHEFYLGKSNVPLLLPKNIELHGFFNTFIESFSVINSKKLEKDNPNMPILNIFSFLKEHNTEIYNQLMNVLSLFFREKKDNIDVYFNELFEELIKQLKPDGLTIINHKGIKLDEMNKSEEFKEFMKDVNINNVKMDEKMNEFVENYENPTIKESLDNLYTNYDFFELNENFENITFVNNTKVNVPTMSERASVTQRGTNQPPYSNMTTGLLGEANKPLPSIIDNQSKMIEAGVGGSLRKKNRKKTKKKGLKKSLKKILKRDYKKSNKRKSSKNRKTMRKRKSCKN